MNLIRLSERLWAFRDTCNVYAVTSGSECLLIDTGSGGIMRHLPAMGVDRVDWVLHTHHHRDQCWGTPLVQRAGAKVAVPKFERHLFDRVEGHWQNRKIYDNYNDSNIFFSLGTNVPVDYVLEDYEVFYWKDLQFRILPAKGHTYGMVCLIAVIDGATVAFTGDLMTRGGKLYQLHAMEYAYGDFVGVEFTMQSILALKKENVATAYPSHGEAISEVNADILRLESRLEQLANVGRLFTSGRDSGFDEWETLRESKLRPISEHLLWAGPYTCSNFYVVLDGDGHAMLIDYGLSSPGHLHFGPDHAGTQTLRFVEHHLDQLRHDYGVRHIEVVIPTHIHDDHICGIPYLQRYFGTQCWALDRVAEVIVNPAEWASTPCCFDQPINVHRVMRDGEEFQWRGFDFKIFYAPGQTEYHSMILANIDYRRILFSGDNVFLANSRVDGHEREIPAQTTVMRNSFQLEMHRRCAGVMLTAKPDVLCPGHGQLITMDQSRLSAYLNYIKLKEAAFRDIVDEPTDRFIDVFWARMLPYTAESPVKGHVTYRVKIRNNLERTAVYGARLLPPRGWRQRSKWRSIELPPAGQGEIVLEAIAPAKADARPRLMTAEILIDGISQGPVCEALVSTIAGPPG